MAGLPFSHRIRGVLRRSSALRKLAVTLRHRGLRPDDVFVASYPRSGNTWIRFVLADLATGAPADFESVDKLIPNVGYHADAPGLAGGARLIKTHEAHRREYRRGVYVIRDVRDVLISWYRVTREDPDDLSDFDAFVQAFVTDQASPYGRWSDHVRSWLTARDAGLPIEIIRFEDFKADPVEGIGGIASAVGIVAGQEQIRTSLGRNNAEAMRRLEAKDREYLRAAVGHRSRGVRHGISGNWRDLLTPEHEEILAPLLQLNDELGYPASDRTAVAAGS